MDEPYPYVPPPRPVPQYVPPPPRPLGREREWYDRERDDDYSTRGPIVITEKRSSASARALRNVERSRSRERVQYSDSDIRTARERVQYSDSDIRTESSPSPPPSPPPGLSVPQEKAERITISDDRSAGSNLEVRNLAALKDRNSPRVDSDAEYDSSRPRHRRPVKAKKKIRGPSTYESSQGHARLQQRFGRLNLGAIPTSDKPGNRVENVEEHSKTTGSGHSQRHHRSEPLEEEHWVQNHERATVNDDLQTDIEKLQNKILGMQKDLQQKEVEKSRHVKEQYRIVYRIDEVCYFDHPEWTQGHKSIVSRIPVKNLDLYLERNKQIIFIVYRDFATITAEQQPKESSQPRSTAESIRPVSRRLRKALEIMLRHDWRYEAVFNHLRTIEEFQAPYLFLYHHRRRWKDMLAQFPPTVREHLNILAIYVSETFGKEYKAADVALGQRKITADLVRYLFQPGDVLVSQAGGQYRGLVASGWPTERAPPAGVPLITRARLPMSLHWPDSDTDLEKSDIDFEDIASDIADLAGLTDKEDDPGRDFLRLRFSSLLRGRQQNRPPTAVTNTSKEFSVRVWKWSFDGDFKRESDEHMIRLLPPSDQSSTEVKTWNIHELSIYPLRFAPQQVIKDLRRRGEMFWECRRRCLVSYHEIGPEAQNESDERFMIDFPTFRKLHPENKSHLITNPAETMSQSEMDQPQPPDEAFYYLVPLQTKGFNLRSKKWLDLNMDQINPVEWNQKAFDTLVLDRKTKELITALVSNQISAAKSTDVVAGKGNGLILLLHGGPGTGKTLTAEGVAEIAKKPLYRVTCGDVGTKAEEVEGYLESVLHLGKIWDCVVLLDEAEVFLERRSLDDLQRNALVSVFLRVIEYHEGILILTSNRVGTFDEAFRSRIQIAVHYPPLRAFQRLQIWKNFFDRLESFKDGKVDVDELRDHLEELQTVEINGRQIRNAITTARQYADWKGMVMSYEHLKTALEVSSRFDDYSEKLRGGLTDDQIAEEEGIR